MRYLLPILATALSLPLSQPAAAVEPDTVWAVSTRSNAGGALVPAAARPAVADANGNLYVVASHGDGSNACMVTLKYAANTGAVAWRREACGTTHASGIASSRGGDVIVVGTSGSGFRLIKYSGANGAIVWDQRSSGPSEAGFAVAVDGNDDVVMLGTGQGFTRDLWIVKRRGADGSLMWQQPVEGGADITPAGLALDAAGNALVVGTYRSARGDDDWHLAKLAGSSGAILWRKVYNSGGGDVAAALAVDGNGDVTVVGSSSGSIRAVRSAGATGRTLWDQALAGAGAAGANAVGIDAQGNVVVAGFAGVTSHNDDMKVIKYARGDGMIVWQATRAGTGAGPEAARALAIDAAGDVIVTGRGFTADASAPEIRTVKYAGSDGAEVWSIGYRGSAAGSSDTGHAVVAAAGAVFVMGLATETSGAGMHVARYGERARVPAARAALNVQGLWWRGPDESGWGINLTQQGDVLFATWFTYDENGQPSWLVMSEGRRLSDNGYEGVLYRTTGPAFSAQPFDPSRVRVEPVGRAGFLFVDGDHGTFRYEVGTARGTKSITRQVFSSPTPQCVQGGAAPSIPNYQDLWWAPAGTESGWGLNIAHQGDVLFLTWFTYGADGRAMWLVGSNVARTGNGTYAGALYRTVGAPFHSQPWNPASVTTVAAGHVSLAFSDANSGTFTYTLDGVTQSKAITRQVYASPKTVCR